MAKKLKLGDTLRGYRVTKVFGPGAMAISYAAQSAEGRKIFLKQSQVAVANGDLVLAVRELPAGAAARCEVRKGGHYAVPPSSMRSRAMGRPVLLPGV